MRELGQHIMGAQIERERQKKGAVQTLSLAGVGLMNEGRIVGIEIYSDQRDHDVHAFFRSRSNPDKVVHVQAYPGFSDEEKLCLFAREMDHQKLAETRANMQRMGGPSIGNEGQAVTRRITDQTFIPNTPEAVVDLLKNELPEIPHVVDLTSFE